MIQLIAILGVACSVLVIDLCLRIRRARRVCDELTGRTYLLTPYRGGEQR